MKKLILACTLSLSAALGGGVLLAPASAQPWAGGGGGGGLPGGSWQESCRYPQVRGSTFSAECRNTSDRWVGSSINIRSCRSVANSDGRLVCESAGGGWYPGGGWNLPGGSYRQSCRYPTMRGTFLSAQCPDTSNRWLNATVDVRSCRSGRFENGNGRLYCEGGFGGGGPGWGGGNGGGWSGGYPGGSWRETCNGGDLRGDQLSAQCRSGDGSWRGSSISLRGCRSNRVANREGQLVCEY